MISKDALALLLGQPVVGRDRMKIGKVLDIYSLPSCPSAFVRVSRSMLGIRASLLPLDHATMDGASLCVPYTKDEVRASPRVEVDDTLAMSEADELIQYYRSLDGNADESTANLPSVAEEASTSMVVIVVTLTGANDEVMTEDEATTVGATLSRVAEELFEKTRMELAGDPTLDSATARAHIELTDHIHGS